MGLRYSKVMRKIAIADTDADFRRMLSTLLSINNTEIYTARSAQELKELLITTELDLLLSDHFLGTQSLNEIINSIVYDHPLPKVIMFSGDPSTRASLSDIALRIPWLDFLTKPFDLTILIERIDLALSSEYRPVDSTHSELSDDLHRVHKENNRLLERKNRL